MKQEPEVIDADQANMLRATPKEGQHFSCGGALWEGCRTRRHYVEQLAEQGWVQIRRGPLGGKEGFVRSVFPASAWVR